MFLYWFEEVRQWATTNVFKQSGDKTISVFSDCEEWPGVGGTEHKDGRLLQ